MPPLGEGKGDGAMLVLPHYGDTVTAWGDIAISIFPRHGDPKMARVMKPLLILSPLVGDP